MRHYFVQVPVHTCAVVLYSFLFAPVVRQLRKRQRNPPLHGMYWHFDLNKRRGMMLIESE